MRKFKHIKVRNTGLLFECLLRQVTSDVLRKDEDSNAVRILKQKFNENTELGKELALYNILVNKKFKDDKKAEYFISEVIDSRYKLNNSALKREKYNLIKEIQNSYDIKKFLSSKISNYKIYASTYKLFEYSKTLSPEEKTESFFNLLEYFTTNSADLKLSNTISEKLPDDEDLRILTYKTLLEKFNSKYKKLNLSQKSLLRAYINNVSGTNSLKEFIEKVIPAIKKDLKKYSTNLKDKVVKIKMNEAIKSIDKFCAVGKTNTIKDSVVVQTMRYLELLKELKKSGNKNKKVI